MSPCLRLPHNRTEMTHLLFVVVKRDTCWIIFDPKRWNLIKRLIARPALLSCPGGLLHTRRPASFNDVARADLYANIRWRFRASFCFQACFHTCCLSVIWWVDGTTGDHKCSLKMSAHVATSSLPVPWSLSESITFLVRRRKINLCEACWRFEF